MKKVCFIGRGPSWVKAPFLDPEWEIWGMNDCYVFLPRADRWFDIHLPEVSKNHKPRGAEDKNHIEEMNKLDIPVYMNIQSDICETTTFLDTEKSYMSPYYEAPGNISVSKAVRYPIEEMTAKYPNWWTNTLCYMFALAIDEGFEEISICGVDMANPDEFEEQIPAMSKWIGYCVAKGIIVNVPETSILRNLDYLYGYEDIHRETRRKSVLRCYAGQIPSIMQWLNENIPKIYEDNKSNMYQMIDIDFRKEGENLGNSKN
jgi:hypothetical protein